VVTEVLAEVDMVEVFGGILRYLNLEEVLGPE